ncbi:MAG: class D beta-lactamase [Sediminibacterium sp.]
MIQQILKAAIFIVFVYACSPNNVKSDNAIAKLMDSAGMQGSFALLENGTEQFTIHNLSRYKDSAVAPNATFYLIPTLIGLDKGLINAHDSTLKLNDSSDLFRNLISKMGRQTILQTLDSLHYGKGIASADSTHYWENGSLVITPDEQLGLIKRIYFKELFFQKKSQETLKKMILMEDNSNYRLSYIVGADTTSKKNAAWVLGYVEENQHPYFFVLNTNAPKSEALVNDNIVLLKKILLQQGFLKGTR